MKNPEPHRHRLSRRGFLLASSLAFVPGAASGFGGSDEEAVWSLIDAGDLRAANLVLARYLNENKLDHDAIFLHARLSYALDDFRTAHKQFTRVARYAAQIRRHLAGVVAAINVSDVDVWLYLCERRMGGTPSLTPGAAGSINALMYGDISPEAFVNENINQQQAIQDKLQPVSETATAGDGQDVTIGFAMRIPTEELRPILEQNAAFVLAQVALAHPDVEIAKGWLKAVVDRGPPVGIPRWLEYYIARQQLQSYSQ